MKVLTYLESCNKWFAPLDEICEALNNKERIFGYDYSELLLAVASDRELAFYVENFDEYVSFP